MSGGAAQPDGPGQARPPTSPQVLDRAIALTYVQAMLGSVYGASTGGMFLIGFALALGATDEHIGLMSTIPMLCVMVQLPTSMLVEAGLSRRRMTALAGLLNVLGWAMIIAIPYVGAGQPVAVKMGVLISIITLVTLFAHVGGNARGSWVGDLVAEAKRGTFFGRMNMYGGIVGTIFAVIEGFFLDRIKGMGIGSFSWLFGFGMIFGLLNVALFLPQPDLPLGFRGLGGAAHPDDGAAQRPSVRQFPRLLGKTFTNVPLLLLMLYWALWCMQGIAGPFYATYMLRDLHMPFLHLGLINSVVTFTMLACSPFWGRMVNRYGSRPALIFGALLLGPLQAVWLPLGPAHRQAVYVLIPLANVVAGFAVAGVSVGINTLLYKLTPAWGRSVQLAVFSIVVVLLAAPMPALGGYLPGWLAGLKRFGWPVDLRWTFYASGLAGVLAALAGCLLVEPKASSLKAMVAQLPRRLRGLARLTGRRTLAGGRAVGDWLSGR